MNKASLIFSERMIVLLCRVAIGATGVVWLIQGNGLQLSVAIVALALTMTPHLLVRDSTLRKAVAIVMAMLLAAHIVFGMFGSLYETSSLYDKAMHMIGSGAIAGLLMIAVKQYCLSHRIDIPIVLVVAVVLGGTLSAGTLWEIFEFSIDRTGLFTAQRGLHDTMLDLLANTLGGILLVATYIMTGDHRLMKH